MTFFPSVNSSRRLISVIGLWLFPGLVTLGLSRAASASLRFTFQPDPDGNVVLSIQEFGTSTTGGGGGTSLDSNGGAVFGEIVQVSPFGIEFVGADGFSTTSNLFALENPLTVDFGGTAIDLVDVTVDDDSDEVGFPEDDFGFRFASAVPTSSAYTVVDTGFSNLLDTTDLLGNGANARIPFAGFNVGTYNRPGEGDSLFLGPIGDPGIEIVISNSVAPIPEPSTVWGTGLAALGAIVLYRKYRQSARKSQQS